MKIIIKLFIVVILNKLTPRTYRLAKVHAYIISALGKEMPAMFGKEAKKKELMKNLDTLYSQLQREHQMIPGDFPDIEKMREYLSHQDFTKFRKMDKVCVCVCCTTMYSGH